jgi:response regulator RpfG family c-di-GMP phosphodiesterase
MTGAPAGGYGGSSPRAESAAGSGGASPRGDAATKPTDFIVDDHGLFRAGVRSELGDQVDVIGEAEDVQPAITAIAAKEPDVVLLDVHLPGGGGQDVVSAITRTHPAVRFLALSASDFCWSSSDLRRTYSPHGE